MSANDPPWKAALEGDAQCVVAQWFDDELGGTGVRKLTADLLAAVLPHMETAYRTGRMAGASASAARLAQKNLELSKELREVREYAHELRHKDAMGLLAILGDES